MEKFEDMRPMGPTDEPLLADLREVLIRHDALDRFGITLLHRHFDVSEGERLVEVADPLSRKLVIRPERVDADAAESPVATSWSFTVDQTWPEERLVCWPAKDSDGNIVGHMR
jgi:hypothetical protein